MIPETAPPGLSSPSLSPAAPDKRLRIIDRTMRLHGYASHALIETLHAVQEAFGYLDSDLMRYVAGRLKVPLSRVYAVATFYHFFTLKPPGEHTCVLCKGTACHIGGAAEILRKVEEMLEIHTGETTADGKISLMIARCLGSCGLAPAGVFDGTIVGNLTLDTVVNKFQAWRPHDADHRESAGDRENGDRFR
ncbi:hydrogenase HoxE [Desulfosarcina widdelii]|uniref:Hydrogenase HoxE n=1 Tax=Desulfosarcina widdelii TaxID=947919 RepID=A0A5K7ZAS8_9BACT|nr:bidirectional hydrogenase complex protein HoxE [Desulfosarcina widdelii]BBO78956.1 hydrogenase HoxE [Desulfosarcina widdelii]